MSEWSEEQHNAIVALWNSGESAGFIAAHIGRTRSAVLGRLHRHGLGRADKAQKAAKAPNPPRQRSRTNGFDLKRARELGGIFELPVEEEPAADPVAFLDVTAEQCRWPVEGEGVAMLCCGASPLKGLPYCARHCRMAYTKPQTTFGRKVVA
jgi:GcrA cell cycle regulator